MPNIIKDGVITTDNWILVSDKEITDSNALPAGDLILPLSVWNLTKEQLSERNIGVWLDSDESPELIKNDCQQLKLIAINFPVFADGRGYSYAHVLRGQFGYEGELRAIGDVLKDQLSFMLRVGFNSFDLREDQDMEQSLLHFDDFSLPYQGAIDDPKPLFAYR